MHEVVNWIGKKRLAAALRLPSLTGTGLPERMRSTAFALLGLTAAVGLALVALFAQPGFPLLEPAPLPSEPSARDAVAEAVRLRPGHRHVSSRRVRARPAPPRSPSAETGGGQTGEDSSPVESGPGGGAAVQAPAPVPEAPEGAGRGHHGSGAAASPTPVSAPQPPPPPVSAPEPVEAEPEATASSPGPGNSASAAAAEHASERGIEASSGSAAPQASAGVTVQAAAPPGGGPGQGNGAGKGGE